MKKTSLFLLTSVSCAMLCGCYSSPEMQENTYKTQFTRESCGQSETVYQHEGLRQCAEARMAFENDNKKTVTIIPTDGDTLVVPRAYDEQDMFDLNRVYEVVDPRDHSIVSVDEEASCEDMEMTATEQGDVIVDENAVEQEVNDQSAALTESETAPVVDEVMDLEFEEVKDDQIPAIDEEIASEQEQVVQDESVDESRNGGSAQGVTLVVGPLKEDLVISVKTADQSQKSVAKTTKKVTKTEVASTQKTTRSTPRAIVTQDQMDTALKQMTNGDDQSAVLADDELPQIPNFQKNEKEVLPREEK